MKMVKGKDKPVSLVDGCGKSILCCPLCGHDYIHQQSCEAFWREEDAETGTVSISSGRTLICTTRGDQEQNPSWRRDGLRISFVCESCWGGLWLCVVQHKGQTFMYWEASHELQE